MSEEGVCRGFQGQWLNVLLVVSLVAIDQSDSCIPANRVMKIEKLKIAGC